ncbi:hypothetical protein [Mycolicibacterium sp. J2]|uniref:zinc finger domain-containing protein n=1 Tax=Mycolicibacterium sp. J2 TaxID=2993511 RepID=UPI00224B572E|nr:hypothetical protein [Mycolicibacterium sp. J2]MCX2712040.1 hypothetical protein [Mycolicibacterium sp. J2]
MTAAHEAPHVALARQTRQEALKYRCPFCHADPGQLCRTHRGRGRELDYSHSRRIALSRPVPTVREQAPGRTNALCCVCGNLRTVSTDYRRVQDPNYSYNGHNHREGWRMTQSLKCDACGESTRHAILINEDGRYGRHRDYDEIRQRYVLGGDWPDERFAPDRDRMRAEYFAMFPRNPNLQHGYWLDDADKCRAAGEKTMKGLCGADTDVPATDDSALDSPPGELHKPAPIDWDTEFEDPETGLWWVEMQCVDCMRVANEWKRQRRRERLQMLLAFFAVDQVRIPDDGVGTLVDHLEKLFERVKGDGA